MVKKYLCSVLLCMLTAIEMCGCANSVVHYVDAEEQTIAASLESSLAEDISEERETEPRLIYVYICGAVTTPGVYAIEENSRVCDLFELAGGLTKEASKDYWNQARILVDGEMIYVPTMDEAMERTEEEWRKANGQVGQADTDSDKAKKVNINTASLEELMTLPGIGESKALAILAYRQENGGFSSIEELKDISGIKDGVFSKIENYIVVD